jgi:hypothetical protein
MDFTQEQLEFISKIVDAKIKKATAFKKTKESTSRFDFHSARDLKKIIIANLDYFKTELNYEPFRLQGIVHCVRKVITLKPGDEMVISNGMLRLDSQISQLINKWDDAPWVQSPDHPRHLCWKK